MLIHKFLWNLKKVVYGPIAALRNWYCGILQEMENVQCVKSKYDGALFFCKDSILQGIMASHVEIVAINTERFITSKYEDMS